MLPSSAEIPAGETPAEGSAGDDPGPAELGGAVSLDGVIDYLVDPARPEAVLKAWLDPVCVWR